MKNQLYTTKTTTIGPRAVLGSQQQGRREDDHTDSVVHFQSNALRAGDGSRSGAWVLFALFLISLSTTLTAAEDPASKPALSVLQDKTLVAWVSPSNLIQRGGSALTIDDGQSHFDGIIFGEIEPKKWMPGSDFYNR